MHLHYCLCFLLRKGAHKGTSLQRTKTAEPIAPTHPIAPPCVPKRHLSAFLLLTVSHTDKERSLYRQQLEYCDSDGKAHSTQETHEPSAQCRFQKGCLGFFLLILCGTRVICQAPNPTYKLIDSFILDRELIDLV